VSGSVDVTVLMTVYNGLPYLPNAIESILRQTADDFEFLVVNDCSTDETRDVVLSYRDPRIRLVDNAVNEKQTRSLNRGLELAHGELIARMDADDVSHPRRLEKQIACLRANPGVAVVGCDLDLIDYRGRLQGRVRWPSGDLALRWLALFVCPVSCGAAVLRKSVVWNQLGGFDPAVKMGQDWELWIRVLGAHKMASVPESLLAVRRHPGQRSSLERELASGERQRTVRLARDIVLGHGGEEDGNPVPASAARRIAEVTITFERFCGKYPAARDDHETMQALALQYLRVLGRSGIRDLPGALRALWCSLRASNTTARDAVYLAQTAAREMRRPIERLIARRSAADCTSANRTRRKPASAGRRNSAC
jgi:hypothetical protein